MTTNLTLPMAYKFDWFQCTEVSQEEAFLALENSNLINYLNEIGYDFDNFEQIPGRYFYENGMTLGNFLNIYYNSEENKYTGPSIYVQFTGQGTTDLAQKLAKFYQIDDFSVIWKNFFKVARSLDLNITRLDLACDDYCGRLSFSKIERKLERREFTATKRSYNIVKAKTTQNQSKGETIYFGARKRHQNGFLVRFYDKLAEYDGKGALVPSVVRNVLTGEGTGVWQRYEIEIRGSACQNFINKFLNGNLVGELFSGLLKNTIDFKKFNRKTKNKARWETVDWWSDFLKDAEKVSLTDPERDLDLGRLLRWLRIAVVPSLKLLEEIGKEKNFDIYSLMQNAEIGHFSKKQERLKNSALEASQDEIDGLIEAFEAGDY